MIISSLLLSLTAHRLVVPAPKPVVTFAFFGCNRVDASDVTPQNPSTANVPQLIQNLKDVASLKPNYLFVGGDLVMNYADDKGETLNRQAEAWYSLVKTVPMGGTDLIAIPGNHETNRKVGDAKLTNPYTVSVWQKFVKSHGLMPKGATKPFGGDQNPNELAYEDGGGNYSFNRGPVHFVVMNTDSPISVSDPVTGLPKIGLVPLAWLINDLDEAEQNRTITSVFVLGHRNLVDPATVKGDAPVDPSVADQMAAALVGHGKVRAYVCAHVHALDICPLPGASRPLQTTFGNGGSKLEKNWKPAEGRTFGFGYFQVFADGTATVTPYVRPEPADYQSPDVAPATARPSIWLKPTEGKSFEKKL